MSQKENLKEAIAQILSCALQPNNNIQRLTEERKKALEMTNDYGFILLEIIRGKEEAQAEQVMAATFLKNYISDIYSCLEPVTLDVTLKQRLTEELVGQLSHEDTKIRKMIDESLQLLVTRDFSLLGTLINNRIMPLLLSEDIGEISGAIDFMKLLGNGSSLDNFDYDTMYFHSEYIEPLLNILHNENFSTSLRSSTVSCLIHILVSSKKTPSFESTLARLTEVFKKLLNEPYSSSNDFKLRSAIILGIAHAVISFTDDSMSSLVTYCLPAIGQVMLSCTVECKEFLMRDGSMPKDMHETYPTNFADLITSILILMRNVTMRRHYVSLLIEGLNDFIYLLLVFICFGESMENLFVEENIDMEPEADFTIRGTSSNTLILFMEVLDFNKFCSSFHHAIQKVHNEISLVKTDFPVYYSKMFEALMYALGLYSVIYEIQNNEFMCYVELWSSLLDGREQPHWIVLGRLLWLGGRFSPALTQGTLHNHLVAILSNYRSPNTALRIACYDALRIHLSFLASNPHKIVFSGHLNDIVTCLLNISLFNPVMASLCLKSMANLCECFPDVILRDSERIVPLSLNCFLSHIGNVGITKDVKLLLSKIVAQEGCSDIVKDTVIPFAYKFVFKICASDMYNPEKGFEILDTVIKYYPRQLEDNFVMETFLEAWSSINDFQDSGLMEIATIYITNLLMKASFKIKTLRDLKGKVLAEYVCDMLFKLLEPYPRGRVCPSKFGRLCVISIMTLAEQVQPYIEAALKALLSALQRTDHAEPIKSYCFIFAYMFTWQTVDTIGFLSGIPGPDGQSALSYFLNKWTVDMVECEKFERSIITLGICTMIEHSLTQHDDRINNCRVSLSNGVCSGLEKLYLLLVRISIYEINDASNAQQSDLEELESQEDVLIKNHPVYNLNLVEHIKGFLTNYNSMHFATVFEKYMNDREKEAFEAYGLKV